MLKASAISSCNGGTSIVGACFFGTTFISHNIHVFAFVCVFVLMLVYVPGCLLSGWYHFKDESELTFNNPHAYGLDRKSFLKGEPSIYAKYGNLII